MTITIPHLDLSKKEHETVVSARYTCLDKKAVKGVKPRRNMNIFLLFIKKKYKSGHKKSRIWPDKSELTVTLYEQISGCVQNISLFLYVG